MTLRSPLAQQSDGSLEITGCSLLKAGEAVQIFICA
jgi:hypothetical protein